MGGVVKIGKPLSRRALQEIERQEQNFNAEVRSRMTVLIAQGVPKQDAFDRAWVDCGGLIVPDEKGLI